MTLGTIVFERRTREDGALSIMPLIDGIALIDRVATFEREYRCGGSGGRDGLVPEYFRFGPLDRHFMGRGEAPSPTRVVVLGCDCGEWGCNPFFCRVEVDAQAVRWSGFERFSGDEAYAAFGPFVFERGAYEQALKALPGVEDVERA